jgi:hypothetical protein
MTHFHPPGKHCKKPRVGIPVPLQNVRTAQPTLPDQTDSRYAVKNSNTDSQPTDNHTILL